MKINLKNEDIYGLFEIRTAEFPKYTTQIMNLANQNSQGTRPKVVGQLSDLIQIYDGDSFEDWVSWYNNKHPNAISNAVEKVYGMILNLKEAIKLIDKPLIEKWVKDLVVNKTYFGLRIQDIILKKVGKDTKKATRLATADEESQDIDGFIGKIPVQIKPESYKQKVLPNDIDIDIIFYEKKKTKIIFIVPDKFYSGKSQSFIAK